MLTTKPRVCAQPGCPRVVLGTRCDHHKLPPRGRPHRRNSRHVMTATHCAVCGKQFRPGELITRGHIIALEDGGTNESSNYQAECERCNKGRAAS